MAKKPKKWQNCDMTKELDKKRLLAILEKKAALIERTNQKNDSYKMSLFLLEDLQENGDDLIAYRLPGYVAELLIEIEQDTHRRFELKNPFPIKSTLPLDPFSKLGLDFDLEPDNTPNAYEVVFNPWIRQKDTEDFANELNFELKGNELRLMGFPFSPIKFESDIKVAILKELAHSKENGSVGTAEIAGATGASGKIISNYIKEINDKVCEVFKLQDGEFIPKSSPKSGYKLGDRVYIQVKG